MPRMIVDQGYCPPRRPVTSAHAVEHREDVVAGYLRLLVCSGVLSASGFRTAPAPERNPTVGASCSRDCAVVGFPRPQPP